MAVTAALLALGVSGKVVQPRPPFRQSLAIACSVVGGGLFLTELLGGHPLPLEVFLLECGLVIAAILLGWPYLRKR